MAKFSVLKPKAFKKVSPLKAIPMVFSKKEKFLFFTFFVTSIISAIALIVISWQDNTEMVPAKGGIMREGVVGQPRFLNPVYASSNDVDRDLVNLIYSGLFKYNAQGEIVPDLVKEYSIEEGGKIYDLILRQDASFQDGTPLTADDVVFTINTIQNPDFQSPIQAQWLDVEVKRVSDYQLKLTLKNPYPAFLETLTLKILPAHLWQDIPSQNFPLCAYNFNPIGSGPFEIKKTNKDKTGQINSIVLKRNENYYGKKPYLSEISFIFFSDQNSLYQAAENNIVDAFSVADLSKYNEIYGSKTYSFSIPRYYALFFNPKEKEFLTDQNLRKALVYATNKQEIINQVLNNKGEAVSSPFLLNLYQFDSNASSTKYDPAKALEILKQGGFEKQDGKLVKIKKAATMNFSSTLEYGDSGKEVEHLQKCLAGLTDDIYPDKEVTGYFGAKTREAVINFQEKYADEVLAPYNLTSGTGKVGPSTRKKLNEVCIISPAETIPLEITITTSQDPMLVETAEVVKGQWEGLGLTVNIETLPIAEIKQNTIKERDYQILLFGQVLGIIPDPFPFWHSSQRVYPGLNLAYFKNKTLDKLLEEARTETDTQKRFEKYAEAEKLLLAETSAVFLYNPNYLYIAVNKIKGIKPGLIADSSQRFAGIEDWYINTKRSWK